jgi:protein TonB
MQISTGNGESMSDHGRLGAAFLVALALHVGAVAAVAFWPSRNDQSPPGEQEITIDLAPAMEQAEAVTTAAASAPAEVLAEAMEIEPPEPVVSEASPEETTEIVEEVAHAQPPEAAEPVKPAEPVEAVPADTVPTEAPAAAAEPEVIAALPPPQETAVAKELEAKPKPVKLPPAKKPTPKPRPAPREAAAERRSAPSMAREGQASWSRENTGGAAAAADPSAFNRYAAQIAAALRGRLRYPEAARAQGLTGVATVRFTMQRSGQIVSAAIVRSASLGILDQAALAAAAPGTSLPPAPDSVPQAQFTFVVPLRFNLR